MAGFNTAISGIRAATAALDVTGNNIANASTTGFKSSRTEFADIYATAAIGSGASNSPGSGVLVSDIAQDFSGGNVQFTNNNLDLSIDGSGFFQHGHTYLGHPVACAAANAVVTKLTDGGLIKQAAVTGDYFADRLQAQFGQHPHVGDIRGRGMFRGIEFVADRETKQPFDPELKVAARLKAAAMDNGLICYPMSGTIDGRQGDHVLLAPPFICTRAQIDELVGKLSDSIAVVI